MHEDLLTPTIGDADFAERFVQLHKQLWCSDEFDFESVTTHVFSPPPGMYQVDHSFLHDGTQWHLYYVTGDLKLGEVWNACRRAGDSDGANRVCVEPGNGHAVGPSLERLTFVENVFFEPQGRFDLMSRGVCSLFRHNDRYGMLYDVRGDGGERMSVAWSTDLSAWTPSPRNPVLGPGEWANPNGAFKDPHVMAWRDGFLIFVVAWDRAGQPCVGLITTKDWRTFHDHGPIFRMTPSLRGTFGIESPQVLVRDEIWHLFFTHGAGVWHAIAPSPTRFMEGLTARATSVSRGAYLMGPFHATEIVELDGLWWMTTDRKEQTRRLNRASGRMCYRGSYEDERTLEEGLYLSQIRWEHDRPLFTKPRAGAQVG
jgi:hypothetical protein